MNAQNLSIPLAIVIAGALVAGALYFGGNTVPGDVAAVPSVNIEDVTIQPYNPVVGDAEAPVILAYWFDYQCPFCKTVDVGHPEIPIEPSFPMIMEEYVQTGKVKIVFKNYAFLGPDSETGALYKHAVWELFPARFYEFHEAMMLAQDEEHGGFGDEASILTLLAEHGFDADTLRAKVAEARETYLGYIAADRAEGTSFGIGGTPGIITGTTLIPGAESPATFRAAIDAQL